jgi:hypothetical protein
MKRFTFLAFILVLLNNAVFSQPGFPGGPISKADSLRSAGNLKGAITEMKKQVAKDPASKKLVYNCACNLSLDQQLDSCFKYLEKARKLGPIAIALSDPDLLNAREDRRWNDFENNVIADLNKEKPGTIKDIPYAKSLLRLMVLDQSYFYETGIAVRKLGFDSPVVKAMQKLKSSLSERNLKEVEDLISRKGWPKISEVGPDAAGAPFYIIQHSDSESQAKYLPALKARCEEKEASWVHYAMLYDRLKMNQNLPQRYGTQAVLNNTLTGAYELYKLEDEKKVNDWRKEVGLPPLKQ